MQMQRMQASVLCVGKQDERNLLPFLNRLC